MAPQSYIYRQEKKKLRRRKRKIVLTNFDQKGCHLNVAYNPIIPDIIVKIIHQTTVFVMKKAISETSVIAPRL